MDSTDSHPLCFECGLCCNGVLFADGQLQPEENVHHFRSLGLALPPSRNNARKFRQPCAVFGECRCRIYPDRPRYCREFECLLLKDVNANRLDRDAALGIIRTARQRADDVFRLLAELGDTGERTALSVRFRRMQRRLEKSIPSEHAAEIFGRLTLAVHDLNLLLSGAFYPGANDPRS